MRLLKRLWSFLLGLVRYRRRHRKGYGISLLVPFKADNARRLQTWEWLERYWKSELPGAEVIVGTSDDTPFCKTAAVNDAAARATGDVVVILDADAYVSGDVLVDSANQIREARKAKRPLWFVPYRYFYRLSDANSRVVLMTPPDNPPRFFAAPPSYQLSDEASYTKVNRGHWYGALIQILPREAFDLVGGMDERFAGWGGEDVSFMHAVDTLYGKHRTTQNGVIHLWHPSKGADVKSREWQGQSGPNANGRLAWRYSLAVGDRGKMQKLVDERG
jgi:hypothetical protein